MRSFGFGLVVAGPALVTIGVVAGLIGVAHDWIQVVEAARACCAVGFLLCLVGIGWLWRVWSQIGGRHE